MTRLLRYAGCIIVLVAANMAAQNESQNKPATPAEKYQTLLKELQDGDSPSAQTPEERKQAQARRAKIPLLFLELAEENSQDPVALEALIQTVSMVNGTANPVGGKNSPGDRALAQLIRDHARSEKLGRVCQQVLFGFHKRHEEFLRAVLERNPHTEVQGLACLSLAQFLNDRLNRLALLPNQPDLIERYDRVFGKEYMEELQRQDRAGVAREAEALFQRAAEKYAGVTIPVTYYGSGGTVGEKAKAELFQIRNLAVGKVAPEIEGEDQDGKPFKLSDYRGKVVLIDFWYRL
jgi:AhpC/TSA family